MIRFDDVDISYGRTRVLAGVTVSIARGDIAGIVGPSGAGKSTLLHCAAGLIVPSAGTVSVEARRIGMVFQEPRLLPWRTALDNVVLPLVATGMERRDAVLHAREWLGRMEMDASADLHPAELSGGMAQRVALARALAVRPDLLILDEPFRGLDVMLRESVRSQVLGIAATDGMTVLWVSHEPGDVADAADRLFVLRRSGVAEEIPSMDRDSLRKVIREASGA